MNSEKRILLHTAYQLAARLAVAAGGIITTILLTRYLGPLGYSKYTFAFTILWLFGFLADFGLSTVLVRELARKKGESLLKEAFTMRFLLCSTVFMLVIISLRFLPYSPDVKQALIIVSLSQFIALLSLVLWSELQARLQFGLIALIQTASAVLLLALNMIGVSREFPFSYFLWIHAAAAFFAFAVTVAIKRHTHRTLLTFEVDRLKRFARKSLPFAGWVLVTGTTFRLDTLILSFYRNPSVYSDIGIYGLSYKFFEVTLIVGTLFTQSLYPYLAGLVHRASFRKETNAYLSYSALLGLSLALGLYLGAPFLIRIGGGSGFEASIGPLRILAAASGVYLLSTYLLTVLTVLHKEIFLFRRALVAFVINLVLNLLFIPTHSYMAAAWTTLGTQLFVLLSFYAAYRSVKYHKVSD